MHYITPNDIAEIQNLVALYCVTTDNADADGFMQTWVESAEFGGYDSGAFGKMDTWEAMHAFEKEHVGPGGMANGKRHLSLNIVIEAVSPTEAAGWRFKRRTLDIDAGFFKAMAAQNPSAATG